MQNSELKLNPPKAIYYFLFTASGFSGLIYESIWSHYLKLFLGHAAYAQSLVLSIFMGGMAIGAWLAGQYSSRLRIPVLAYAVVEGIIGVLALIFHGSFTAVTEIVYNSLLPATDSIALAHLMKWTIASLMIIPQSILLGMTFPLMTAGIIRRYPQNSGSSISLLYFTNSIGAAIGVLASGFWLIEAVGLPGTIMTAGLINILLALTVWVIVKLDTAPDTAPMKSQPKAAASRENRLLLGAACVTGMASFIYEIGWIRMLSLVLGSATHSFELMLSAFITGLACGGLWIRNRINTMPSPLKFAGYVQILMGILALLTVPLYHHTFDWMGSLLSALDRTEQGYSLLLFSSHAIALAVMLPATFCAGMTLPLFTHALLKTGYGEKSIGRIYAFNTAGSIAGVLLAVNALPMLGLKNLIGLGALLDTGLGIILLASALRAGGAGRRQLAAVCISTLVAFLAIFSFSRINPEQLASGVFRYGRAHILDGWQVYFHRDGKTSSVSLFGAKDDILIVSTNGKPDASIRYGAGQAHSDDETTMVLLGVLPYAFKPDARTVANIGLGSGLTTHTLLGLPQIERVDTIEIEPAIVEASRLFGDKVARAHTDPRSRIHIEDAKTFFSINHKQYDIIVSEPSNPWVSGVSSLFTREFYTQVQRYLAEDGIFVQWLHSYESNWLIIASVLKAVDSSFGDYALYSANDHDMIIIAHKNGPLGTLHADKILNGDPGSMLTRINIRTEADLDYRFLGNRAILSAFLQALQVPENSDYFPFLDVRAHKAFFMNKQARLNDLSLPFLEILQPQYFNAPRRLSPDMDLELSRMQVMAGQALRALQHNGLPEESSGGNDYLNDIATLILASSRCNQDSSAWLHSWHKLAPVMIANLDRQNALAIWSTPSVTACMANGKPELKQWIEFYRSVALRDGAAMSRRAQQLLQSNSGGDLHLNTYLLGAAMLGEYSQNRPQTIAGLWQQYSTMYKNPQDVPLYLQILVKKAAASDGVQQ